MTIFFYVRRIWKSYSFPLEMGSKKLIFKMRHMFFYKKEAEFWKNAWLWSQWLLLCLQFRPRHETPHHPQLRLSLFKWAIERVSASLLNPSSIVTFFSACLLPETGSDLWWTWDYHELHGVKSAHEWILWLKGDAAREEQWTARFIMPFQES